MDQGYPRKYFNMNIYYQFCYQYIANGKPHVLLHMFTIYYAVNLSSLYSIRSCDLVDLPRRCGHILFVMCRSIQYRDRFHYKHAYATRKRKRKSRRMAYMLTRARPCRSRASLIKINVSHRQSTRDCFGAGHYPALRVI